MTIIIIIIFITTVHLHVLITYKNKEHSKCQKTNIKVD